MSRNKLEELREEYYSDPDSLPETDDEIIDDELLALEVLFKTRAVTVSGQESITVEEEGAVPAETDRILGRGALHARGLRRAHAPGRGKRRTVFGE